MLFAGMKVNGIPSTSAYSTAKKSFSSASYDTRRSARPITCSHSNCVPNARTPSTCVTVGVPALGQHGDGYHAAYLLAQAAGLADSIHHFAQQIGVRHRFRLVVLAALTQLA